MAQAKRARHPKCGKRFPYGDRTGHCSGCCETIYGIAAFDKHRRNDENGERVCLPIAEDSENWRKDDEDRWHYGPELSPEEKAKIWGKNTEEDA